MTVQTLWIRGPLTPLAHLSLASFMHFGLRPTIWTYDMQQTWPHGVEVRNARELLPERVIEDYTFGEAGQLALFGDKFSWEMSFLEGGWIGHLDFMLLRDPGEFDEQPYVFGPHHRCAAGTSFWKAPVGSSLVQTMRDAPTPRQPLKSWYTTLDTMSKAMVAHHMRGYVVDDLHHDDGDADPLVAMMKTGSHLPEGWKSHIGIHWCGSGNAKHHPPQGDSHFLRCWDAYQPQCPRPLDTRINEIP